MYENLKLGVSPLTGNVFLGKVKKKKKPDQKYEEWCDGKRDITNNFIQCVLDKFEPNTETGITVNGEPKYKIIVCDADKTVEIK
jgi:hypothetical protein